MPVTPVPAPEPDDISAQLTSLAGEVQSANDAFKAIDPASMDLLTLAAQVGDLFSILSDAAAFNARFAAEQIDWADGVDADLDDLKSPSSQLLPTDAVRIKMLLGDLAQHLPDDASSTALKARVAEAVTFIDEITIDEGEDEDDEDDETEE